MEDLQNINLDNYWMPFTPNRKFKSDPRLIVASEGMHYTTQDGRKVLDGIAGLWCCNAGHCHPKIVKAVQDQVATLDYATAFNMSHPKAFELAEKRLGALYFHLRFFLEIQVLKPLRPL